jgi:hypothetical protein
LEVSSQVPDRVAATLLGDEYQEQTEVETGIKTPLHRTPSRAENLLWDDVYFTPPARLDLPKETAEVADDASALEVGSELT